MRFPRFRAMRAVAVVTFFAPVSAYSYDWLQFNGDSLHGGNNTLEATVGASNVAKLVRVFQATLPAACDGAPAYLSKVATPSGRRDLLFCVTTAGDLVALDAKTGASI